MLPRSCKIKHFHQFCGVSFRITGKGRIFAKKIYIVCLTIQQTRPSIYK